MVMEVKRNSNINTDFEQNRNSEPHNEQQT